MTERRDPQEDVDELQKRFVEHFSEIENPHRATVEAMKKMRQQQSQCNPPPIFNT